VKDDALHASVANGHHSVGQYIEIFGVMGDDHHRDVEQDLDALELGAHATPQQRVEGGERFIEQQKTGFADQGTGKGDPLALSPGEGVGIAG